MAQNIMAATSATPGVIVQQQVPNSETTVYTVPSSTSVKIASASVANTTGTAATIAVSLVKAGGNAGASSRVVPTFTLAANDSSVLNEIIGSFLGAGDSISVLGGTNAAVTLVISGVVFT